MVEAENKNRHKQRRKKHDILPQAGYLLLIKATKLFNINE